jgi:ankyrin repeat protein
LDADPDYIRFLLDAGAEVNVFDDIVGYSPLMVAAMNSNVEIFNMLIDYGADYAAVNDNGVTVLHVATMNDSPEMVLTLLGLGAKVQARDGEGKTALDRAIEFRCNRVEPLLREAMGLPAAEPSGAAAR